MSPRLALYVRVSTADQAVDAQLDQLRAYAARRGGDAMEFVDQGHSGRKDRRPALDALLAALRRREFTALVISKLDRLSRSTLRRELDLASTPVPVRQVPQSHRPCRLQRARQADPHNLLSRAA